MRNKKINSCFIFTISIILFSFSNSSFANKFNPDLKAKAASWSKVSSVKFLENKGQMVDMNNAPVPFVLFKAEAPGMNVYITEKGLTYLFFKNNESEGKEQKRESQKSKISKDEKIETEWVRINMFLKNASIKKENIIKEGESKNFNQYFLAHCPDGITDVHSYEKITIKKIYPGIDWVLYNSSKQGFKYDFVIHPNADVNQIKLIYEGVGEFNADANQIKFKNEIGEMIEGKLYCYQGNEDNEINSSYIINKNIHTAVGSQQSDVRHPSSDIFSYEITIQLNSYDHSKELIIDPQLTWATIYGGNDLDGPLSIDCDAAGNVFTTGYIKSTNFPTADPATGNYFQGAIGGDVDFSITKFDKAGAMIWSTYYGGTKQDLANFIHIDVLGNVYLTGHTFSTNFPVQNLAGAFYQGTFFGTLTVFVLKFNTAGNRLWSTYYGISNAQAYSMASDNVGNIFIVGETYDAGLPTQNPGGGAYFDATHNANTNDAFILKFNAAGARQWCTYYGDTGEDNALAVCTDPTGNVFVAGKTTSANFPTMNAGTFFQGAYAGSAFSNWGDVFLLKFTNAGVRQWATYYGGSGDEQAISICSDSKGNIFVAGTTSSNNFPVLNPGGGAYYQTALAGGQQDAFISKFSNTGNRIWSTYLGGGGRDNTSIYDNLDVDNCDNVYYCFYSESANLPTQASCDASGYIDNSFNGLSDQFIWKFSNNGNTLWATYFGGNNTDVREAIAIDNENNLYLTAEWTEQSPAPAFDNSTYPFMNPGGGAYYDNTISGPGSASDDGFIAKFISPKIIANANAVPSGCAVNISASATGGCSPYVYNWYNNSWTQIGSTQTISNVATGTYYVIIRDSLSCSVDTASVVVNSSGTNVYVTQSATICNGQNYTLPGGGIASTSGTYSDTLLASNGCDSIITTNLTVVNAITQNQSATICTGQNYTLPGGGSVSAAGTYNDTLLSYSGCDSIITTTLNVVPFLTGTQNATICTGQSFTLPDNSVVTIGGTYTDTITSTGGCDSVITTILTVNPPSTFSQNINRCVGQTYALPGGGTATSSGTYYDTLTTTTGCDSIITTNLNFVSAVTSTQNINLCTGQSHTLPGGTVVTTAGNYVDTIASSGGCDSIITTSVTLKPNSTSTQNPTICSNESYTLPNGTQTNTAGTYYDTVTSSNGCDSIITTTLVVNNMPTANITGTTTIITGQSTTLTASGGTNYSWFPSTGLDNTNTNTVNANPTQTTMYCVEVTNTDGCKDTSCVTITVELPCPKNENLQVPNAFSPNNDNINDEFCLQGWTPCNESFLIIIYDRWGEKVFESVDPNFCWDGKYKGKEMDAQVFVYYLKAGFLNMDKTVTKNGNISLIK